MSDALLDAVQDGVRVFDLARPMSVGMPQSPNHPEYRLSMPRRHGDSVRADGGSAANDLLVTGTHVGTHIDALGHVSHDGMVHGGLPADEVQRGGRLSSRGVDEINPMVCRGVLLDVARALGVEALAPGVEITPGDLQHTATMQGVALEPGDALLIRSGWGRHWGDPEAFLGATTGVPGVSEAGASWLADHAPRVAGADTIAFERLAPGAGHTLLPAHRVLLVDRGVYILETLALDELAEARVFEFTFVLAPLPLVGATGSPVRPLALTSRS